MASPISRKYIGICAVLFAAMGDTGYADTMPDLGPDEKTFEQLQQRNQITVAELQKIVDVMKPRAENGDSEAAYQLGWAYAFLHDKANADRWRKVAVNEGHPWAQFREAVDVLSHTDPAAALALLQKSAAQGNHKAQAAIGTFLRSGSMLPDSGCKGVGAGQVCSVELGEGYKYYQELSEKRAIAQRITEYLAYMNEIKGTSQNNDRMSILAILYALGALLSIPIGGWAASKARSPRIN